MRKELRGFTLIYISTKPSKRYVLRKRRKFRANYDDDSGNFNVDHLVKRGAEVAHVNAEGNETASSGTKIFLYLVKGILIYFKILRFGEVTGRHYISLNNIFHFIWRENINMHAICPRSLSVLRSEQFSESVA